MAKNKIALRRKRIKLRIRKKVNGTSVRPRLTVFRSNRHIYAQLIDDEDGRTLAAASSLEKDVEGGLKEMATEVGKRLGTRAKETGIEEAVFDRNAYRYHGRVKALAEGARESGLTF